MKTPFFSPLNVVGGARSLLPTNMPQIDLSSGGDTFLLRRSTPCPILHIAHVPCSAAFVCAPYGLPLPLPSSLTLTCQLPKKTASLTEVYRRNYASVMEYLGHWRVLEDLGGVHGDEFWWEMIEETKEKGEKDRVKGGGKIFP